MIHQLLEEREFKEKCAYCANDFIDTDTPTITRSGAKEYITVRCSNGHTHTTLLDMARAYDGQLLFKHLQKTKHVQTKDLENVVEKND